LRLSSHYHGYNQSKHHHEQHNLEPTRIDFNNLNPDSSLPIGNNINEVVLKVINETVDLVCESGALESNTSTSATITKTAKIVVKECQDLFF
jgi:hypothetical protein